MKPTYPYTDGERRHLTLHGYDCALQMGPYSINGYITLPADHPWLQGDPTTDPTIDVHGGITYHKGTTIGFDTNHHNDGYHPNSPGYQHATQHDQDIPHALHWTWQETGAELARLAEQANEAHPHPKTANKDETRYTKPNTTTHKEKP